MVILETITNKFDLLKKKQAAFTHVMSIPTNLLHLLESSFFNLKHRNVIGLHSYFLSLKWDWVVFLFAIHPDHIIRMPFMYWLLISCKSYKITFLQIHDFVFTIHHLVDEIFHLKKKERKKEYHKILAHSTLISITSPTYRTAIDQDRNV